MYETSFELLRKAEADFFDIYREESYTRLIEVKNGKVESVRMGSDSGVGIRLTRGLSVLFSSVSDTDEMEVEKATRFLLSTANPKKGLNSVSIAKQKGRMEAYGGYPADLEKVKEIFETFNSIGYAKPEIKQVSIMFSDKKQLIKIINEEAKEIDEQRIYTVLFVEMTAKKGDVIQSIRKPFGALGGFEFLEGIDLRKIAYSMRETLIELINAPPLKAGTMPVVLSSEAGGTMIHEAVGHGLEADLVYESMSVYKNRLNTEVASQKISVVDDATRPKMRGSYAYDDEGTPSQNTLLIENGILRNYMFDKTYAKLAGRQSTGNARRESYRFAPIVRMSNTYILPGEDDPEEIIVSVDNGLFVKRMGGGQVNPVTGDFVFEVAEGYTIEKGKIGHLVRGATLVGNGPEILKQIDMVGSDFGVEVGTCGKGSQGVPVTDGEPTLRIPSILVGGNSL